MNRRIPLALAATAAAALLIQGCANGDDHTSKDAHAARESKGTDARESKGTDAQEPKGTDAQDAPSDTVTAAHEDSHRSVYTLSADQVEALTGHRPGGSGDAAIARALQQRGLWEHQKATSRHADRITAAAAREQVSLRDALKATGEDDDAVVRVYVAHDQHANIAHIGTEHHG
ncbi:MULTISPECIES: hypothetical protein [unclassified Streptomyces]|uniref:hypothetical protein n=1 Tax=unclassified Streptomyces TaxID=2593676 RepID=UPI00278C135C|nr:MULTISPECIES: hypothetical protein [unclassified Streptomyces]